MSYVLGVGEMISVLWICESEWWHSHFGYTVVFRRKVSYPSNSCREKFGQLLNDIIQVV